MSIYDPNNIFARILTKDIPCHKIAESAHALAFTDISPQAPTHILVIPKGAYVSFADFSAQASEIEIVDFIRLVGQVANAAGIEGDGYRLIANHGAHAHQEVAHFHVHLCGGRALGPLLSA